MLLAVSDLTVRVGLIVPVRDVGVAHYTTSAGTGATEGDASSSRAAKPSRSVAGSSSPVIHLVISSNDKTPSEKKLGKMKAEY